MRIVNTFFILVALLLIFAIGYQAGQRYDIAIDENNDYVAISYSANEQKIRRLLNLIDNHYVDTVNTDSLIDNTIDYIVNQLDPHSVYLNKRSAANMQQEMQGFYTGIGIEFIWQKDTILITKTSANSLNKNLLKFGDKIIQVNRQNITSINAEKAEELIQGKPNTFVNLSILRGKQSMEIQAKRGLIKRNSISSAYMLNDCIGYIKLTKFTENAAKEFESALQTLTQKGMRTLIFDLRGNPGGLMHVAEDIANEFLKKEDLIVFTKDKKGKKEYTFASGNGQFEGNPLYVLIDEGSASASEIIAGAIQDNDAGTIVGRRSYGKGLVQREISLGDDTKLRLTTAKYYTPSGRSIQKNYKLSKEDYQKDIQNRYMNGEMFFADSIAVPDSLKFKTKKGKTVYGGGGIVPDIFIPMDSIHYGTWYYGNTHQDILNEKLIGYLLQHKEVLESISSQDFITNYDLSDFTRSLLNDINIEPKQLSSRDFHNFSTFVKAQLAWIFYGDAMYQRVLNDSDIALHKIKTLENHCQ